MQKYYKQFDTCKEHDIPVCADACPFKMDILTIQDRITKKRFNAAYKSIRDCVVFPGIVSQLCPAYCENACVRNIVDTPVQIKAMEQSVISNVSRKTPNKYNLPSKVGRIAVIGAGLSGMGFAFRMASKKYDVTIFEKTPKIGGHLAELMDEESYMSEFALQFQNENYLLKLNSEIKDIRSLCRQKPPMENAKIESNANPEENQEGFDVIYVATGKDGNTFDVPMPNSSENLSDQSNLDESDVQNNDMQNNGKKNNGGCMIIGETAVFIGGEVCGSDLMHGLADGINIASAAENYLKTKKLEYPVQPEPSGYVADKYKLSIDPGIIPESGCMSEDECVAEARRCIRCQCDVCTSDCDLVTYFDKMPAKMRDEIFLSCKPAGSLVHKSPARKYVAACTMCGLMQESCPEHIDLCGMVKYARHKMHEAHKVPAAYRQYFMRDMAFANGEHAALKRHPKGNMDMADPKNPLSFSSGGETQYAFFPGCNLGALDPEYVLKPYKWLLKKHPNTSILLKCCGVPVDWNGNTSLHNEEIEKLKADWISLGKPILIMACMSCMKHIGEYLPEIKTVSLYEIMQQWGFDAEINAQFGENEDGKFDEKLNAQFCENEDEKVDEKLNAQFRENEDEKVDEKLNAQFCENEDEKVDERSNKVNNMGVNAHKNHVTNHKRIYSIFDPCSARNRHEVQDSIRTLLSLCGINTEELPGGDSHGCCGFGGMGSIAAPDFSEYVAQKRSELSDNPYIVYCSNCRDIFCDRGKEAIHILDILFNIDPHMKRPQPDVTQRRVNRVILKNRLLKEIWKEEPEMKPYENQYTLTINEKVREKINRQKILEEDICQVIDNAEATGRRTFDPQTGHYKAYKEIGYITCWVEYSPLENGYEIHNLYTHRMKIELEAIWNGKKADIDM